MYKSDVKLNRETYRDKVLGCWAGKNIGGTLGAPIEGRREIFHYDFYINPMDGEPAPNDDLDLQLVWLKAMEDHGPMQVNERILGEYWMRHISGPWNEYGVARNNMANGILPPLSGSTRNDVWKNSNGAWIRSEIWACVFAGDPDWAAWFAWCDACVDHADDGVWAEIFTASLEAAAFVESDLRKLIEYAFARIPSDSRVARSVKIAIDCHDSGKTWEEARNAVVADSADLGWFQAPANVAFAIIGLLYGDGDFGKTVCTAINCGDDTDCTGATAGAVLGIIKGYKAIPEKWMAPIGHAIKSIAVRPWLLRAPATIEELSARAEAMKECACAELPSLPYLVDGPTELPADMAKRLSSGEKFANYNSLRACNRLYFDLPWCKFSMEYLDGAVVEQGQPVRLRLRTDVGYDECASLHLSWKLPEGWTMSPAPSQALMFRMNDFCILDVTLTPGPMSKPFEYIPVEATLTSRMAPVFLTVPFALKGASAVGRMGGDSSQWNSLETWERGGCFGKYW